MRAMGEGTNSSGASYQGVNAEGDASISPPIFSFFSRSRLKADACSPPSLLPAYDPTRMSKKEKKDR